ncbi:MAG TPA: MBL fold metallo-hydrolase [Gaiellaceae bacterium]|nr:MBL fold metallo-hydrolase [Gaiellaceae bacterium]
MQANGWEATLLEAGMLPIEPTDIAPEGVFPGTVWAPINVLLLRGHGRTVLVDAGSGPFVDVWPGLTDDLGGRLEAEGASPDLLVLTHFDFDHSGGLVTGRTPDELRPTFPGVTVLAPAEALAEARSADEEDVAAQVVATLDAARLLDGYEDGAEPAPGLRLRAAQGHRLGHSIVEVGDSLVHVVDIVHDRLHVEHLDWDRTWDADPEVALATRGTILAELAERGSSVLASHIPEPGRIERAGDGLRWASLS